MNYRPDQYLAMVLPWSVANQMMLTMGEDGVGIGVTAPGVSGYNAEGLTQPLVLRGERGFLTQLLFK